MRCWKQLFHNFKPRNPDGFMSSTVSGIRIHDPMFITADTVSTSEEDDIHSIKAALAELGSRIAKLQFESSASDERFAIRILSHNSTVEEDIVESGDVAFLLFCTLLVTMMTTPGIMLYYSGQVRLQSSLSSAIQAYAIASVIVFLWLSLGYSICFGSSSYGGVLGSLDKAWLRGVGSTPYTLAPSIPEYVFCSFQLAFAIITPSLICGAFANRMKFWAVIAFISLWHLLVYCPLVHSFWHPDGWLSRWGVQDFAGGCAVHISAGFSALVSALMVGKHFNHRRIRRFHPHNKVISAAGACFLIVGWYGFNAGSSFASNAQASLAFLNTHLACAAGSVTWMIVDCLFRKVPSFDGIMNGGLAGLVAITPCAGYVDPTGAFVVGVLSGAVTSQGVKLKGVFGFDDALDAFGIHGVAGVLGVVLSALLNKSSISGIDGGDGLFYGGPWSFLGKQLAAIVFTIAWAVSVTAAILKFVDAVIGLRVSRTSELIGLDASEHGNTSSQMQKSPQPRHKQSPRGNSPRGKRSNPFTDVGKASDCWPCSRSRLQPPPNEDISLPQDHLPTGSQHAPPHDSLSRSVSCESMQSLSSDENSYSHSSSSSSLTKENKKAHDSKEENKKVDSITRCRSMVVSSNRSGVGKAKIYSTRSLQNLSELDIAHPPDPPLSPGRAGATEITDDSYGIDEYVTDDDDWDDVSSIES